MARRLPDDLWRIVMRSSPRNQSGFTIVEMIITMCIIAVLASVAIREMRDYSRRATLSEVVLAATQCNATWI
jgi:type IV pilus assembly protein PilA